MQIRQLEADLVELGSLLEKADRKRVQDLLKQEKQKVEKELALKKQQKEQQVKREADPSAPSKAPYTVKITNYGMVALFSSSSVYLCKSATVKFCLLLSLWQHGTSRRNLSRSTLHWRMSKKIHQKMSKSNLEKGEVLSKHAWLVHREHVWLKSTCSRI